MRRRRMPACRHAESAGANGNGSCPSVSVTKRREDASMIKVGKAYLDRDGLHRYVVSKSNAAGRRAARVLWRRPGAYVEKLEEQTVAAFAGVVRREDSTARVDPAPKLPKTLAATT